MKEDRRDFIKKSALSIIGAGLVGSTLAEGYSFGKVNKLKVAVVGVRSRGEAHLSTLMELENVEIVAIVDVDSRVLSEKSAWIKEKTGKRPKEYKDFRKMIEDSSIDVVCIASPDHTHTPFAIRAMEAGKHVYLEKPLSHNLQEGQSLVEAAVKSGKVLQIGNQQRSAPTTIRAVSQLREGRIGELLSAKCWYSNKRGSIGKGNKVPVPEWLDWDLFQGPAPKVDYRDNIVHYNWHWFWDWGTGEVNNNGLHEIDICRYAMGLDLPEKVVSKGGRFYYDDDWEFYDTQTVTYSYTGGKTITWEGNSCNGLKQYGKDRGCLVQGTKGSVILTRNGAEYFDISGNLVEEDKEKGYSATTDLKGAGALEVYHFKNFINAIRKGEKLNSPVADINISNAMCHYGNMAQLAGHEINIDPLSGKVTNSNKAMERWSREYDPQW